MNNPFKRKPTDADQHASAWANAAANTEQWVEELIAQGYVAPEVTEALQEAKDRFRKWTRIAAQGGNSDGNE